MSATPKKEQLLGLKPIELIFGVIIAQSFVNLNDVFIPIKNIFELHNFVDAFGIGLAYFIVITGLLGYHKSIHYRPHSKRLGSVRYFLDLMILFFVYYMVTIANPKANDYYGMIFLWVIPVMVFCYLIWDVVKYYEYRHQKKVRAVRFKETRISAVLVLITAIFTVAYYFADVGYSGQLEFWNNKTFLDFVFMILYLGLFFGYRLAKARKNSVQDDSKVLLKYK